ncbi:tyrosine-type recombinase/integrase [Commensalibacter nepenthis]|uniref:tyrosine-type recombinase/integrase n=1 Tax=Commensalibacter nepenthis TaxID=3043872 RepID=UPI003211EF86
MCDKTIDTVDRTPAHPVTKLALRFLSLTAVRPNEVRGMSWEEIKGDVWVIPAERMKMRKEHQVPLSRQAIEVLEVVKVFTGHGGLVFPNSRTIMKPMSENAMGYLLNRAGYKGIHVPHGFRASFSGIMNEKYPNDRNIIDLMLAHAPTNTVEAAYNRAEHLDRRKILSQIWADLLFDGAMSSQDLLLLARR